MSLTIEHLLSTESWQDVLKKFGNRYGVMKVFIDEQGEEDTFPFDDQEFDAKAINQEGLDFIKSTLESLDADLNRDDAWVRILSTGSRHIWLISPTTSGPSAVLCSPGRASLHQTA